MLTSQCSFYLAPEDEEELLLRLSEKQALFFCRNFTYGGAMFIERRLADVVEPSVFILFKADEPLVLLDRNEGVAFRKLDWERSNVVLFERSVLKGGALGRGTMKFYKSFVETGCVNLKDKQFVTDAKRFMARFKRMMGRHLDGFYLSENAQRYIHRI